MREKNNPFVIVFALQFFILVHTNTAHPNFGNKIIWIEQRVSTNMQLTLVLGRFEHS